ncbi:DUF2313 domain-containing protein [Salmonella enterica]|nr:DUF2313 domain-containing protein [Salmonella enterica]EGL7479594.1 DUF2313 domain-containing protein [Salmonella enterica]EIZ2335804.1 DUF2313 domain-containing protein [Salmonella enterica]
MSSRYNQEQYLEALSALMPRGQAWTKAPGSVQQSVLSALARSYARSDRAAVSMLKASFPATATDFLTEWETSLGLPDACGISETGVGARQQAILARLAFSGGQSRQFYITLAKSMGYDITLSVFRQARAGLSHCGDALNGDDWPSCLQVTLPGMNYIPALCQRSYCGDPLRSWGNRRLACTVSRQIQSHTAVLFECRQGIVLTRVDGGISGELVYPDKDICVSGVRVEVVIRNMADGSFRREDVVTGEGGLFSISPEAGGSYEVVARARFTQQSYGAMLLSSDIFYYTG